MEQSKYCAFISYRHLSPDQEIAKALHTAIETYRIPTNIQKKTGKKRMGRVFRDQEELPLSADLGADIETALDSSDWLIVVCSPRYRESRWCMRELEYFIEHKGRERVIAILAEGEPADSFPEEIRCYTDANGNTVEVDPHAADARGADMKTRLKKLKNEKLRLLAPMLSVTYDELKQREKQRRLRTFLISAAAVFVAAVGLGTFLTVSHIRNEALKREAAEQQRIAEEQARLAEEQAKLAEERQKLAEEQRILALNNQIGELTERSETALERSDRIASAQALLEALELSDQNGGIRREQIVERLQKTALLTPFSAVTSFSNQNERILDIEPSPDGRYAIGVINQDHVCLIDFSKNEIVYQVSSASSLIIHLEFSPDGSRFLANYGTHVTVWNASDGSEVFTYTGSRGSDGDIANVFFWRDADTLLVQDFDTFCFVDIRDGSKRPFYRYGEQQDWYDVNNNLYTYLSGASLADLFTVHREDYYGINVTPSADRTKIMIGGRGGETGTLIIDETGALVCPLNYMPATFFEENALSPDGTVAIWLSQFGLISGWDVETGALLYLDPIPAENNNGFYSNSEVTFSPDSKRAAYVSNHVLYVIDARSGQVLLQAGLAETEITAQVAFSSDGRYILLTDRDLYIIDADTYALLMLESASDNAPFNNVIALENTVFACDNNGAVRILCLPELTQISEADAAPGELRERYYPGILPDGITEPIQTHEIIHGYWEQHNDLPESYLQPQTRVSREGDRLAVLYPDGAIELYDAFGDGHATGALQQLTMPITAFGMVRDRLIATDYSGRMLFYDLAKNKVVKIINEGSAHSGYAFTEQGDLLMALRVGTIPAIDVYDTADGTLLFTMNGPSPFEDFAFTVDETYAVGWMQNGGFVVADLLKDETTLLEHARNLAALFR